MLTLTPYDFLSESFAYAPSVPFELAGNSDFGNEYLVVLDGNILELSQGGLIPSITLYDDADKDILHLEINPDYSIIKMSSYHNVSSGVTQK